LRAHIGGAKIAKMDTGLWTLRCQNCGETFTIELKAGQQIVQFARSYICSNCKTKPNDALSTQASTWHRVIGFHCSKIPQH